MTSFLKPTIFIIDDDPAFKSSLSWQLENVGFITKTFSFLETFFNFYRDDIPGCLIIDINATGNMAADFVTLLHNKKIYLSVIFLSDRPEVSMAVKAIKLGASDFLYRSVDSTTLLHSINQALRNNHTQRNYHQGLQEATMLYSQLSNREKEVYQHVLHGFTNNKISEILGITLKTVEAHRANVMTKMKASNLPQLVTMAVKYHLIEEIALNS